MVLHVEKPRKRLGAWAARTNNTIYQAATDGTVHCHGSIMNPTIVGFTDGITPPTVQRVSHSDSQNPGNVFLVFKVRKDDYWKVTGLTAGVMFWIPDGP